MTAVNDLLYVHYWFTVLLVKIPTVEIPTKITTNAMNSELRSHLFVNIVVTTTNVYYLQMIVCFINNRTT